MHTTTLGAYKYVLLKTQTVIFYKTPENRGAEPGTTIAYLFARQSTRKETKIGEELDSF